MYSLGNRLKGFKEDNETFPSIKKYSLIHFEH